MRYFTFDFPFFNGEDTFLDNPCFLQFDLAWVVENWKSEGFDLWEEVKSNDFYFNRMAFVYSLNVAADFGNMIGRTEGEEYRTLAETIRVRLNA